MFLKRIFILILILLLVSSCQPAGKQDSGGGAKSHPDNAIESASFEIIKNYQKDVLRAELKIDQKNITAAEQITLILRAETDENFVLEITDPGESLGDFTVAAKSASKLVLTGNGRVMTEVEYLLEPPAPGNFEVAGLKISSWEKGKDEAYIIEIETEMANIAVESLFKGAQQEAAISDIAQPAVQPFNKIFLAGIILLCLVLVSLLVFLWQRKRRKEQLPTPPLPPHIIAYSALEKLVSGDLFSKGFIKEFYAEISDILRIYIEQRFGLRAPERTTEEFLSELGALSGLPDNMSGAGHNFYFSAAHKELLKDFLTHCDLVKFARHIPGQQDAEQAVGLCRKFIKETEPPPEAGKSAARGAESGGAP